MVTKLKPWKLVWEGEGNGGSSNDPPPPNPPSNDPPPPNPPPPNPPPPEPNKGKLLTQEQFDKALAEEKRKAQKQNQQLIAQLEELKKTSGLSAQQVQALEARIEELQTANLTEAEKSKRERERLAKEHETKLQTVTSERDKWKTNFTTSTIERAITDAAISNDAYRPHQVIAILKPLTSLIPEKDAEGNPLDSFMARVRFPDTDKDGKAVILDFTVPEAVKRMKEMDEYANLFKSAQGGGIGGSQSQGIQSPRDIAEIAKDPQRYRQWREKQGIHPGRSNRANTAK